MSQWWCMTTADRPAKATPAGGAIRTRLRAVGVAWAMCLSAMAAVVTVTPVQVHAWTASAGMATMQRSELPPEGRAVLSKIENGDAFSHPKDGSVFGNRERLLPRQTRGYYREYTVPTPGLNHRGARRIVCGGEVVRQPAACYYTEDHYASFRLIAQRP